MKAIFSEPQAISSRSSDHLKLALLSLSGSISLNLSLDLLSNSSFLLVFEDSEMISPLEFLP